MFMTCLYKISSKNPIVKEFCISVYICPSKVKRIAFLDTVYILYCPCDTGPIYRRNKLLTQTRKFVGCVAGKLTAEPVRSKPLCATVYYYDTQLSGHRYKFVGHLRLI